MKRSLKLVLCAPVWVLAIAIALAVPACKKGGDGDTPVGAGTVTEAPPPAAPPLPGGAEVLASLQQKDYKGAVRGLSAIKARLTAEQRPQYMELLQQTKEVLVNEIGKNPAAMEAWNALRFMETGR